MLLQESDRCPFQVGYPRGGGPYRVPGNGKQAVRLDILRRSGQAAALSGMGLLSLGAGEAFQSLAQAEESR